MERKFSHYQDMEEYRDGMWRVVRGEVRKANMAKSADLMRDIPAFEGAMMLAMEQWPTSCAVNLTAEDTNRLAWLGHAGCCLAVGSPEENTRCGWHALTGLEQDAANDAAQRCLDAWIEANDTVPPLLKIMEG